MRHHVCITRARVLALLPEPAQDGTKDGWKGISMLGGLVRFGIRYPVLGEKGQD